MGGLPLLFVPPTDVMHQPPLGSLIVSLLVVPGCHRHGGIFSTHIRDGLVINMFKWERVGRMKKFG